MAGVGVEVGGRGGARGSGAGEGLSLAASTTGCYLVSKGSLSGEVTTKGQRVPGWGVIYLFM